MDQYRHLFGDIEIVLPEVDERLSEAELLQLNIEEFDGVLCGDDTFTEAVLSKACKLKVISKWGTGIDSIDSEACLKLGIKICNVSDIFTNAVADTAMGYILVFARRLFDTNKDMHNSRWHKLQGVALHETILGIVGVGNAGKAVARRAKSFGMQLLGNDIVPIPDKFLNEVGIKMISLDELCAQADFITLHCDLNSTSYHLIREKQFQLMKPTAYLINTSRGQVVDERALASTLWWGKLAGAALDVFEQEPLPPNSMFRIMPSVLLGPHNANTSPSAKATTHLRSIRNLLDNLS